MNKLFRLICTFFLIVQPILGEAVNFPTTLDDDTSLYDVKNNNETNLDGNLNISATTVTVDSTSGFPTSGFIQVENEVIYYTGKNSTHFTGCTRGSDGTSAATHLDNAVVIGAIVAAHHNILKDAVVVIETELGVLAKGAYASVKARLDAIDTVLSTTLTQNQTITLAGDATGTGNTTITVAVADDSHNHTASTISGLSPTDFTSSAISQWFNDSGFITTADLTDTNIPNDITISTDKSITASAFYGDGSHLSGITTSAIQSINGMTDATQTIAAGTNITISSLNGTTTINSTAGGGGTWGSITGTLADQTDLNNALGLKVNTSDTANWNTAYGWGNYATASFGGDATGTIGNIAITDDSHNHTGSTISGLGVGDFTSSAVSQFYNDAGYKTTDSDTTYTAGDGLLLTGTTFSIGTLTDTNIPDAITLSSSATVDAGSIKSGTVTASVDAGSKILEIPNGTSLPATCNVGEVYSLSNASANEQFYVCSSSNTWSQQNGTLIAAKMTHSTNIVVTDSYQSLSYDTEEYDYGNLCSTTTTRFNITETGVYAYGMIQSFGSADVRVALRIVKNNTSLLAQDFRSTGTSSIAGVSAQSVLVPNDYLEFRAYATNTTTANASSANDVSGAYIAKIGNSSSGSVSSNANQIQNISVSSTAPTAQAQVLGYDSTNTQWRAKTIVGGTGITVTANDTTLTVSGSASASNAGTRVYNNADVTSTHNNTATPAIPFNSEVNDDLGIHDTVTNNSRLTIATTGWYMIVGQVAWDSNSSGCRMLFIRADGTTDLCQLYDGADTIGIKRQVITTIAKLNKDQYIELCNYQNSGSNILIKYYAGVSPILSILFIST